MLRMCLGFVFIFLLSIGAVSHNAYAADVPYPRIKPVAPNQSRILTKAESKAFRKGVSAAQKGYWKDVAKYRKRLTDSTAINTLRWLEAWRDHNVGFDDLTYVTQKLSDWPRMTSIRAKAEKRLAGRKLSPDGVINWFQGVEPVSGEGRAILAEAYFARRNTEQGKRLLKLAWRESSLTRDLQRNIYNKHKNHLTPQDHAARADYLIWRGSAHFSKVNGLLSLMPKEDRALSIARMKVATNGSGMDSAINAVPASLRVHPGLIFERGRWRRKRKTKDYALPVFLTNTVPPQTKSGQKRLWTERKIMTYWAIKEKKYAQAYQLCLNHGQTSGTGFAEAEFLAGWLALTKLNRTNEAIRHFETLRAGVTYPVSRARASYWLGRAHKKAGLADAPIHFAQAADHIQTYYGQLAAAEVNHAPNIYLPPETDGFAYKAEFEADPRVRALRLLGESRNERFFNTMAFHLDDEVVSSAQLTLLAKIAKDYDYMKPSIRASKQAARFNTFLPDSGYPIPDVFKELKGNFDLPFSLAISRQESEFNTHAVSSAKAYGLMQMINGTARATARKHGIAYSRSRLTSDPAYSVWLGSLHLRDLMERYNGSYICLLYTSDAADD